MTHLIDKEALLAEIDRRIKILQNNPYENHKTICHLDSLKQSCNTLEVKEVDLEMEISKYIAYNICPPSDKVKKIAKHFFELGLKAQKGE